MSWTGVADHSSDASVIALGSELIGRSGAAGHAGGVLQVICEEEGVVRIWEADAFSAIIVVAHTCDAPGVAIATHGLVVWVGGTDIQLELSLWT